METPIRRLDGITYWVIENPEAIYDFIDTEIRKEWTEDARSEHRDTADDEWLKTLVAAKMELGNHRNSWDKTKPQYYQLC